MTPRMRPLPIRSVRGCSPPASMGRSALRGRSPSRIQCQQTCTGPAPHRRGECAAAAHRAPRRQDRPVDPEVAPSPRRPGLGERSPRRRHRQARADEPGSGARDDPRLQRAGDERPGPSVGGAWPRRITTSERRLIFKTATERPRSLRQPFSRWSIYKVARYLATKKGPKLKVSRERLRQIL